MKITDLTNFKLENYKHIHLIGIGGVSMSAIAETLKHWNYYVTGSDLNSSELTDNLIKNNIPTCIGHDLKNSKSADLIIYSAAIKENDPEMIIAIENNIPVIDRGTFVGYLTKQYKQAICVSGTHGKTTTTSMLSMCFIEDHKDPSIEVGAIVNSIGGNYRIGNSDYFILESCEYMANFLKFYPDTAIILNIDNDHLDYYKTFDNVVKAFQEFATHVDKENGLLVTNADDENCFKLKDLVKKCSFVSYGIENTKADFIAKNISYNEQGFPKFDVYKNDSLYGKFTLSVTGKHNILNALATIATCDFHKISLNAMQTALKEFTGASRRLEYKGTINDNVLIFDDYAHHPTEIEATATAIKNKKYNESWVVFQPHTYSRTKAHLDHFAKSLSNFDHVILLDIYAAREIDTREISSKDLQNKIISLGHECLYMPDFNKVTDYLKSHTKSNDIIITLGAGTVTIIGPMLLK